MPLSFNRETFTATHPSRPFPWLPWIASALFVVGLVAALATLAVAVASDGNDGTRIRVMEAGSTTALSDAEVAVNGETLRTDDNGYVNISELEAPLTIEVTHDGHHAKAGTVDDLSNPEGFVVALRPVEQTSLASSAAQDGIEEGRADPPADGVTDLTGSSVSSRQTGEIVVATPGQASSPAQVSTPVTNPTGEFAGSITNAAGEPVQGALITDGLTTEVTGADGLFQYSMAGTSAESIRVFAPGYAELSVPVSETSASAALTLELQDVKAIYFNPNISDTQEDIDRLVNLINTTEVNALVIDIKEELIFYDSNVPFFEEAGTVRPTFDLTGLLATLEEHDIYSIARLVVFKDSIVAEKYPDLAVRNNVTGEVWRDMNGVAWVNPMLHVLWDANADLAVEAANLGFDEIQYDYVRFPTDGDLSTMEFGLEYTEENRVLAISKFLEQSKQALLPTGAKLSADVFGFTMLVPDDLGIGQDVTELAPHVDYLSPMVYPSHFPNGSMALDGHPNDYPYETIEISMRTGREQLGSALQLRPWLQDFDFFDMMPYGPEEVRAQIQACEDVGTSGWMLWDPNNIYTDGALGPDAGNMAEYQSYLPEATPVQTNQARSGGRGKERE